MFIFTIFPESTTQAPSCKQEKQSKQDSSKGQETFPPPFKASALSQ